MPPEARRRVLLLIPAALAAFSTSSAVFIPPLRNSPRNASATSRFVRGAAVESSASRHPPRRSPCQEIGQSSSRVQSNVGGFAG